MCLPAVVSFPHYSTGYLVSNLHHAVSNKPRMGFTVGEEGVQVKAILAQPVWRMNGNSN